jgi:hypothetical protein
MSGRIATDHRFHAGSGDANRCAQATDPRQDAARLAQGEDRRALDLEDPGSLVGGQDGIEMGRFVLERDVSRVVERAQAASALLDVLGIGHELVHLAHE